MEMAVIPHVSVLCLTFIVHVICSSVISPRLVKAWLRATQQQHVKNHTVYLVLGYLAQSLVVGLIALFCFLCFDSETIVDSPLPLFAIDIALAYFVTELATDVIYYPSALMEDKPNTLHHFCVIMGLGATLYWQGILVELSIIKLISQLTIPLVILRLLLLNCGMSDTLTYLVTFTAMILAHFLLRIAVIPKFWRTYYFVIVHTEGITLFVVWMAVVSLAIDVLDLYWFARMVRTYVKYYPEKYNFVQTFRRWLF